MSNNSVSDRNREVVKRLYDAGKAGDMEGIGALVSADVLLVQSPGHPVPGRWEGRQAMLDGAGKVFEALHSTGIDVKEIVADGPERVIGLVEALGEDSDGNSYRMPVAETFLVRDGKVVEI